MVNTNPDLANFERGYSELHKGYFGNARDCLTEKLGKIPLKTIGVAAVIATMLYTCNAIEKNIKKKKIENNLKANEYIAQSYTPSLDHIVG